MNQLKDLVPWQMGRRSTRGHVRRTKKSLPWWLVVVALAIGAIGIWGLVQIFWSGNPIENQSSYRNRTWLNADNWTQNQPNQSQVDALVDRLHENNIDRIYVEAGTWYLDGTFQEYSFAEEFRDLMNEADPDIEVLVWIWVTSEFYTNSNTRVSAVSFAETALRDWGYNGVHLQGYSVYDDSQTYVQLVRSLDTVTEDHDGIMSLTVPPDRRPADPEIPIAQGNQSFSWSPRYKQQLALIVDEMVLTAYPSGFKDGDDYREWFAYQVKIYADEIYRINEDVDLIIALPTYAEGDLHDPTLENMENGIRAAHDGIDQAGSAKSVVHGAGVYVYSTTTSTDWVLFNEEWVTK